MLNEIKVFKMEIKREQLSEVKQRILTGLDLVAKKLTNSDIVIFKDGKVQIVKSADL